MPVIIDGTNGIDLPVPLPVSEGGTNSTATATAGGAVYGTGTAMAVTATGTAGQVLTSNAASAPAWAYLPTPIKLQTAVATTSGTSIDFTGIPAGVKRVCMMFNGISTNGTSPIIVQFGTSAGLKVSGYVGSCNSTAGTITAMSSGFIVVSQMTAAVALGGLAHFHLFGSNIWCMNSQMADGGAQARDSAGFATLAGELTSIRLTTIIGTEVFDLGSVNISWEF